MTVVTVGCSGYMNTNHHLVPPLIFAKVLWEACHIALGQPFEFLQHLLPLVHRTKTLDPKHDLHLYLKGQPLDKRLVFRVHESLLFHDDCAKHEMWPLRPVHLIHLVLGPMAYSRQDLLSMDEKSVPMGGTP